MLYQPVKPDLATMWRGITDTFKAVGIGVEEGSSETLSNLPLDIHIGFCDLDKESKEQQALFAHRNNAGRDEICVYFVRSIVPEKVGCASRPTLSGFPNGRASAIVTSTASPWTLAHECGHLLGLDHVTPLDRLMYETTAKITQKPPLLIPSEGSKMTNSPIVQ